MKLIIPYGTLPTRTQFNRVLLEARSPNLPFRFRRDIRIGNKDLSSEELWYELRKAHREGTEESLTWCCNQLQCLNVKWRD